MSAQLAHAQRSELATFVGTLKVPTLPFKGNLVFYLTWLATARPLDRSTARPLDRSPGTRRCCNAALCSAATAVQHIAVQHIAAHHAMRQCSNVATQQPGVGGSPAEEP